MRNDSAELKKDRRSSFCPARIGAPSLFSRSASDSGTHWRRRWIVPGLLVSAILGLTSGARATTAIIPSDDHMIVASRAIIRARVISQRCGFDSRHDIVYTYVSVRVREVLKGQITSREIVLKEPGGQVATLGTTFFGSPNFTSGEDVILYLDTWPDGSLRVHDMFLGKFIVTRDPHTGQLVAIRQVPGPHVEIIPLSPAATNPAQAQESTSRLELSAYLRLVRRKVAANVERSRQFEQQYYGGRNLLAEPPDYQDLARSGQLVPQFHLLGNARWFEPDSGQPVTYLINPDGAPPGISDDINAAMSAWSSTPGCSLRIVNGGFTTACTAFGVAVATFNNCTGLFPPGSDPHILAEGGLDWNPGSTKVVSGIVFSQIVDGFLAFNPSASGFDPCSVQEVLTHEMGHSVGMGHSWDPTYASVEPTPTAEEADATMFYVAHFDGRCASIKTDDINGISFIYPGQGSGGGGLPPVISTTTLPSGVVSAVYSVTLAATGGTSRYTWTIASGSNPPPPGLALSSGGAISGTPASSGDFGFTVVVTDSASRTAQRALSILIADSAGGGGGGFNAQFVSQSVPTTVLPGSTFQATITWNNVGTAPWNSGDVNLGSQNPANNTNWGKERLVFPPRITVNPAVQAQMFLPVTAPSTPGIYQFQWQLTEDSGVGFFGDKSPTVAITVGNPASVPPLAATAPPLPTAIVGTPYSQQLLATGGLAPYTWSVLPGSLPAGLNLDPAAGTISGTPTAEGSFNFTVTVSDSQSTKATAALSLHILVVGPEAVPHINVVKYKPGPQKLIIIGQNFDPAAVVLVDQAAVTVKSNNPAKLLIKPIGLASGSHTVTVVNPNGVPSTATLNVN